MIRSMTGFGQSRHIDKDVEILVELKSVNHRFLEVNLKSPEIKSEDEEYFKKTISKKLKRGKVDIYIKVNASSNGSFQIDRKLLTELKKISKKILRLNGGILLIDYGYLIPQNKNTLQSLIKHRRNNLLNNLGKADITSLVNFKLLNEYFIKNNLKVKKIVTQKFFLERMGIIERAENLSRKMSFKEKSNLYLRLKRLLDAKMMGSLFKVIFAYKFKKDNFLGFE